MIRIRRIFDDLAEVNQQSLRQVQAMLKEQFAGLESQKIDRIPEVLRHPLKYGFRTILYVVETLQYQLRGLALLDYDADLGFAFLDYLASDPRFSGRGLGAALYDRVRSEAMQLKVRGIFFECLPDDPALCRDAVILQQNRARLRFYERYDARPIIGTAYETPVKPDGDNPPYLVFDGLGNDADLPAAWVREVVSAILRRKYADLCTPSYVNMVLESIVDDPVKLRPPRYQSAREPVEQIQQATSELTRIAVVVSDQHSIHHVREHGYVESPARVKSILKVLKASPEFSILSSRHFGEEAVLSVHSRAYVEYFKRVSQQIDGSAPLYPYVFPIRNRLRPPKDLPTRAGYFCVDTFTPISRQAYLAARHAVDCTLSAASELISGRRLAYALVRPPGHHAESGFFGGFCYFNNAAIAAQYLSPYGRVAMVDLDYHHGNGQQQIFYQRQDVLTISLHGHPSFAYPYFSGFADELGEGAGKGFNGNYPLPEQLAAEEYQATLAKALHRVKRFQAKYLVICLGLDGSKGDPTGTWQFISKDYYQMGSQLGELALPSLVVQEGGYKQNILGNAVKSFLLGIQDGMRKRNSEDITKAAGTPSIH